MSDSESQSRSGSEDEDVESEEEGSEEEEGSGEESESGSGEEGSEEEEEEEEERARKTDVSVIEVSGHPLPGILKYEPFSTQPSGLEMIKLISLDLDDMSRDISIFYEEASKFKPEISEFGLSPKSVMFVDDAPKTSTLNVPRPMKNESFRETKEVTDLYKRRTYQEEPISLVKQNRPVQKFYNPPFYP